MSQPLGPIDLLVKPSIPTDAARWLVLGSSPSAPWFLDHALARDPEIVITCNAGIALMVARGKMPDIYALADVESRRWKGLYSDPSVQLVTIDRVQRRAEAAAEDMGWDDAVVFVEEGILTNGEVEFTELNNGKQVVNRCRWQPGGYPWCGTTGAFCLQVAANHCPDGGTIEIVGMDGYRSRSGRWLLDSFDGKIGWDDSEYLTRVGYGNLFDQVAEGRPDVGFVVNGNPAFDILDRPNVSERRFPSRIMTMGFLEGLLRPTELAAVEEMGLSREIQQVRGSMCRM